MEAALTISFVWNGKVHSHVAEMATEDAARRAMQRLLVELPPELRLSASVTRRAASPIESDVARSMGLLDDVARSMGLLDRDGDERPRPPVPPPRPAIGRPAIATQAARSRWLRDVFLQLHAFPSM